MKIRMRVIIILGIFCFSLAVLKAFAVPACPELFELRQPDGTVFLARAFGDEWYNGMETAEGYTILKDQASGYWVYALKGVSGELFPSSLMVGISPPSGLEKHLRDDIAFQRMPSHVLPDYVKGKKVTGDLPVLVLLVEFKDQKLVGSIPADWKKRVFGSSNSVKDFYKETSYGQFNVVPAKENQGTKNDGIVKVKLNKMKHPNTRGNTGDANRKVTKKALEAANKYVDYSKFDLDSNGAVDASEAVFVVVCAGYETSYGGTNAKQPNVWGHRWSLSGSVPAPTLDGVIVGAWAYGGGYTQIGEWHAYAWESPQVDQVGGHQATIGIVCHELGHDAGNLPDLYDTDGSSDGIGKFGLMSGGSWNRVNFSGDSPAHPMAWSKYFMGWLKPKAIKKSPLLSRSIDKAIKYKIIQIETSKKKSLYLLGSNPNGAEYGGKGEYFLLENRQKVGYDKGLPGFGLFIWHIEEGKSNNREEGHTKSKHRLVDLEEADGRNDLDSRGARGDKGDPFPGSTNNRSFTKTTKPHSKWYSGKDSKVKVTKISSSKKKMTVTVSTK